MDDLGYAGLAAGSTIPWNILGPMLGVVVIGLIGWICKKWGATAEAIAVLCFIALIAESLWLFVR